MASPAEMTRLCEERGYWQASRNIPRGPIDVLGNGEIIASLVEALPNADMQIPPLSHHTLSIPFDAEVRKQIRMPGLSYTGVLRQGDVSMIPAGVEAAISYHGHYRQALHLFVAPAFVDRQLATEDRQGYGNHDFVPAVLFQNDLLTSLSRHLRNELLDDRPNGHLLAESLCLSMVLGALRASHEPGAGRQVAFASYRLAPHRLRLIIDYVETHLAENISLADLATVAGCSLEHFKHAFRAQMGEPPYRYLLRQRIARARWLLRGSQESIARIAQCCGFSSQAHFTTAFARIVGETPARWRKEC